jgi:hypothetical protein
MKQMAERVYLSWTIENWITILLMVFVAMFAIGLISSGVRHYTGTAQVPGAAT